MTNTTIKQDTYTNNDLLTLFKTAYSNSQKALCMFASVGIHYIVNNPQVDLKDNVDALRESIKSMYTKEDYTKNRGAINKKIKYIDNLYCLRLDFINQHIDLNDPQVLADALYTHNVTADSLRSSTPKDKKLDGISIEQAINTIKACLNDSSLFYAFIDKMQETEGLENIVLSEYNESNNSINVIDEEYFKTNGLKVA